MFNTQGKPAAITGMDFTDATLTVYAPGTQYPVKTWRQKARVIWRALGSQTLHFNQPVQVTHCTFKGSDQGMTMQLYNKEPPCA